MVRRHYLPETSIDQLEDNLEDH